MKRFGEARAILHAPPSLEGFQKLSMLCLEALHHDEARADVELLPYALETLERWPNTLREPSQGWVMAMLKDHPTSTHWRLIRQLNLSASHTSDELWIRLAALPKLNELHCIMASYTRMSSIGLQALISSKRLPKLARLTLAHTHVALAIDKLPQAMWWPSLKWLDVSGVLKPPVCPTQLWSALARDETALEHLDVSMSIFDERGASALAKALSQSALHNLELSYVEAPEDQLIELIESLPRATLRRLGLANMSAHGALALDILMKVLPQLSSLSALDLQHAAISSATLDTLKRALDRTTLERLDLSGNPLLDHPSDELVLSQWDYPALQWLGVAETNLNLHALMKLLEAPGLKQLQTLRISAAHIEPLSALAATRGVNLIV